MKRLVLLVIVLSAVIVCNGQSTRDVGTSAPPPVYQSTKKSKGFFLFRIFQNKKGSSIKSPTESQAEFEARMKAVAKQKNKEARLAQKAESSDPFYFGHKRKPKKRKAGKKKWCKICQFAH